MCVFVCAVVVVVVRASAEIRVTVAEMELIGKGAEGTGASYTAQYNTDPPFLADSKVFLFDRGRRTIGHTRKRREERKKAVFATN